MKPTHIPPKLLLPAADPVTISECFELTAEEIALRHRLELQVERALYRTQWSCRQFTIAKTLAQPTNTLTEDGGMKKKWKEHGVR